MLKAQSDHPQVAQYWIGSSPVVTVPAAPSFAASPIGSKRLVCTFITNGQSYRLGQATVARG
jgi:hypothetical protein